MKMQIAVSVLLGLLIFSVPSMARGDKIITQVADGVNPSDGTAFRTIIDIMNLGPFDNITPDTAKLQFFHQDGTAWMIATDKGTASEFPLNMAPFETMRIQTSGANSLLSGYAIIRNVASDTRVPNFSEDFELAPSVYYEVRQGAKVIDTVSVPIGQRTRHWQFPVSMDQAGNLLSGVAILSLSGQSTGITLKMFRSSLPTYGTPDATVTFSLSPNQQITKFLNNSDLFPSMTTFKGMVEGFSDHPVAILALLQTPTPTGVQYATLVPAYIDSLRRNTNMVLLQGSPIDLDLPAVDYFADITDTVPNDQDSLPWDLIYEPSTGATRDLRPVSGAQAAILGVLDSAAFDNLTLGDLQNLTYSTNNIDMSDTSVNLAFNFAFAVKTGLGQYAKVRVVNGINGTASLDLVLEIYVFK